MGTGIVSILLHQNPFATQWLRIISIVVFVLNLVLFCLFTIASILRYILYPQLWGIMLRHPVQSLFVGAFPMGLSTLINMAVYVCAPWGNGAINFIWAVWWIDAVLSMASCLVLPFLMYGTSPFLLPS
jgi:tellurite resistance protein TehA-like permease